MQCVKKKNIWTWSTKWVNYRCVRFVHLSMSSLGVFADECSTFLDLDKNQQLYNQENDHIAIRATYYIFCCRNRNWDSPDSLQCWYLFFPFFLSFFLFFVFCFCFFFFNNPISSSICKLPIRCEIYNCTFKNTNKVSIRQNCQNCAHLLTRILMEDLTLFDF